MIECGIYRTDAGLEVRVGYNRDDLMRSQFAVDQGVARDLADGWKHAAIEKGFSERSTDTGGSDASYN